MSRWLTAAPEPVTRDRLIEILLIAAFELLPLEDNYPPHLASSKEARISDIRLWDPDQGWLWDIALGGHAGVVRLTTDAATFQLDLEGAAFVRLDLDDDRDLLSSEFKYGLYVSAALDRLVFRFGYYHLSSHLGDEAMRAYPGRRPNGYSRDTLVAGASFAYEGLRIYGQIGFAPIVAGPAERWEIEMGAELSSPSTDLWGRPFIAIHAHLREERGFAGNFAAQAGWHWRTSVTGSTFRVGIHYYRGPSTQHQFFDLDEHQIGGGSWFDF